MTRQQRLYRRYNRLYFRGKLPNIPVLFRKGLVEKYNAIGITQYEGKVPKRILIENTLRTWRGGFRMTLLHEMVHVSLPYKVDHGPRFEKGMLRLAKMRAFKGLW
ncbi:Uncharacterised protein [uncultured archaeon]|nr:Uncharacterised protein [uncultured archaeon]